MDNLGDKLKRTREAQGLTLDKVATETRIQKKFLAALEEGAYDALPAAVFVTGFLRTYAGRLGLVPDQVVAEYEAMMQAAKPPVEHQPAKSPVPVGRKLAPFVIIGIAVLAVVMLAVPYLRKHASVKHEALRPQAAEEDMIPPPPDMQGLPAPAPEGQPPIAGQQTPVPPPLTVQGAAPMTLAPQSATPLATQPPQVPVPQVSAPQPAAQVAAVPQAVAPQAAPAVKEQPKKETQASAQSNQSFKYKVALSANKEDVWIYAIIDDTEVRDMYIRAGKTVIIRGNRSISLTTGNPLALGIKVNGKLVRIPGSDTNKVIRNWPIPLEG